MLSSESKQEQHRGTALPATIVVVGTAGRRAAEADRLSVAAVEFMKEHVLREAAGLERVRLVSGGSAWADHVAVLLFLDDPERFDLELFLPCAFKWGDKEFATSGSPNWQADPGKSLNTYHKRHSRATGRRTLHDIVTARALGATVHEPEPEYIGFHARNTRVAAQGGTMLAFTFGEKGVPATSGTRSTWNKFKGTKKHVALPRSYDTKK